MSTIADIEAVIENLPAPQVDELADWLEMLRLRRMTPPCVETWLENARGAARPIHPRHMLSTSNMRKRLENIDDLKSHMSI